MFKKKIVEKNELTAKDCKEMLANCKCGNAKDFPPIVFKVESYPSAALKDKYAKDHNIQVLNSYLNPDTKNILYEYMVDVHTSDKKEIKYEDICKAYGWKSFELSENQQTIYPKWLKD